MFHKKNKKKNECSKFVNFDHDHINSEVHSEGVKFICCPHLIIIDPGEVRADLMARSGPQMNRRPENEHCYCYHSFL